MEKESQWIYITVWYLGYKSIMTLVVAELFCPFFLSFMKLVSFPVLFHYILVLIYYHFV